MKTSLASESDRSVSANRKLQNLTAIEPNSRTEAPSHIPGKQLHCTFACSSSVYSMTWSYHPVGVSISENPVTPTRHSANSSDLFAN